MTPSVDQVATLIQSSTKSLQTTIGELHTSVSQLASDAAEHAKRATASAGVSVRIGVYDGEFRFPSLSVACRSC
jgi:hypothetical protein